MSLSIDSKAVLRAVADNPDAFPAVQADIDEFARKMLGKQLKAKSTDTQLFKRIYSLAGERNMATIFDGYAASDFVALVKKIDPHSSFIKDAGELRQIRNHVIDLATDRATPVGKSEKVPKSKPAAKSPPKVQQPKIGGVLESKVHSGRANTGRTKRVL